MRSEELGLVVPEILLPDENVNMKKWSVVAVDQYTADTEYWDEVARMVGSYPSALHIVLPEAYLGTPDAADMLRHIREVMRSYLEDSILKLLPPGFILVERHVGSKIRQGLMVALDLEAYDTDIANHPVIRPTEEVIHDKAMTRADIRVGADIEIPHILILMDDPERKVIEPLYRMREELTKVYDFDLMKNGGHIAGYFVGDNHLVEQTLAAMEELKVSDGMRFAVGDGNHSLAAAKLVWENAKRGMTPEEQAISPLRYALAELVNIYDDGITFNPIHRVIRNCVPTTLLQYMVEKLNKAGVGARLVFSRKQPGTQMNGAAQNLYFISRESMGRIEIERPNHRLTVGVLQPIIEQFLRENDRASIEYVHGDDEFERLATDYNCVGFAMPAMRKETFFDTVCGCGVLPPKTFSLGEADEKRYYLECRLLTPIDDAEEEYEEEYIDEEYADEEYANEEYADEEYADEEYADEEYEEEYADEEYDEYIEEEYDEEACEQETDAEQSAEE